MTPHAITLRGPDGADHTIEPSGSVARVTNIAGAPGAVPGIPCPVHEAAAFGEVIGLPEPAEGIFYLVSGFVGAAVGGRSGRGDVLVPGTGPNDGAVRNEKGHVVAVTRLNRV